MSTAFAVNLVHFVRHLRDRGFQVGPATIQELTAAIDAVGLAYRADVKAAFEAVVVARPTERPIFEDAFESFFGKGLLRLPHIPEAGDEPDRGTLDLRRVTVPILADMPGDEPDLGDLGIPEVRGASAEERLATRDFRDLSPDEAEEVRRIMARIVWRPAHAQSRRWTQSRQGTRPDMRRTMRNLVGPGGDMMQLAMAQRKPRRRPLVVLADVSGSMEQYAEMFLHFLHAAQGRLGRVETFVFATHLSRITRELRHRMPDAALRRVGEAVDDWSGGTRIGDAVAQFNVLWGRRVTRGGAIGLIISDGWDTGDPALLGKEMARFARSMHRVIWLNPLAGRANYAPETRGMQAALPFVDDLLSAANILDLREVVRLLESVPARR
ncbi:MAG: VWA domain-containing protein [bacterium]|nr:VWA domain-containing protein [bacterium]